MKNVEKKWINGSHFCTNCGNKVKNIKWQKENKEQNKKKPNRINKKIIYLTIGLFIIGIIGLIIIIILNNKPLDNNKISDAKNDIDTELIENKKENMIILDNNTKYGATFNLTREDVDNAMKSAYKGSACEKLVGEFGTNNSEWTKVEDGISDYEMYFYIPAIEQKWREMGLCAFKIGICVENDYIQSINFTTVGGIGVINSYMVSEIIKYNSIYEEFYYFFLNKLFNNNNVIQNMNKVENANKVNGISTGGITIEDNIMYGYLIKFVEEQTIYSKQYSLGAVGDEKAKELESKYRSYNTGVYVELDSSKTEDINTNIDTQQTNTNTNNENNNTHSSITNSNSSTQTSTPSNNSNNQNKKEMVNIPYFDMGYELKHYTNELDKLGIKYNVIKGQNPDYEDNKVIKVEHNGDYVEKGTTITITVADNIYNMDVKVSTAYLLELADLGYDYEEVDVTIKINGTTICNKKLPKVNEIGAVSCGTYKGKQEGLKIEATINGKTITKNIHYAVFGNASYGYTEPYIVIYQGGDIGAG